MINVTKKIKNIPRVIIDAFLLLYGFAYYLTNSSKPLHCRTPGKSHLSMIRLFCLTSGKSNDFLAKCVSAFNKKIQLPDSNGVLGNLSPDNLANITQALDKNGYYIFENKLPKAQVQSLYEFASTVECLPRTLDGETKSHPKTRYDKNNLKSTVYDICPMLSLANPDVQNLVKDHSIISVAQHYLRASPKIEPIGFWWSTPFTSVAQSNAAQLFHFDLDRIKWIKFFIFLTDVTLENGPHVFVKQSHRSGMIPKKLLKAGYVRHEDSEVSPYYPDENIKVFTVPAGTIIAEDTRGLHKGTILTSGERLVLEFQFSNSLFGSVTGKINNINISNNELKEFALKHPQIFQLYPINTLS